MRRPRVTATMKRQLADLRARRTTGRMGGVMRVPRIMGVDEWEALASASQDALIAASYEDRAVATPVTTVQPDTNAESERDYQERRAAAAVGGLDYVRHKEEQIRWRTRKEFIR